MSKRKSMATKNYDRQKISNQTIVDLDFEEKFNDNLAMDEKRLEILEKNAEKQWKEKKEITISEFSFQTFIENQQAIQHTYNDVGSDDANWRYEQRLPGEVDKFKHITTYFSNNVFKDVLGKIQITNYRIIFFPADTNFQNKMELRQDYFDIPLTLVVALHKQQGQNEQSLRIQLKDGRIFIFYFSSSKMESMYKYIQESLNVRGNDYFAIRYCEIDDSLEMKNKGWQLYRSRDLEVEMIRQGGLNYHFYKIVENGKGEICPTYPSLLVLPSLLSNEEIKQSAGFRTKNRIPTLVFNYLNRQGAKATLWRSSQNKPGPMNHRVSADEKMLQLIGDPTGSSLGSTQKTVHVYDARPFGAASGNKYFKNAGYEDLKFYKNCMLTFLGIDNIHAVRESQNMLTGAWNEEHSKLFFDSLQKSKWLNYISLLLEGAKQASIQMKKGRSVLIHCSDGWDRTTQLISLTQILLDPYFRTIEGFEKLITKDWVLFGHQFALRSGINCVHQLIDQFQLSFEFNFKFLRDIAFHYYQTLFGTFLSNSEKELKEKQFEKLTISLWSYLNNQKEMYLNPFFVQKGSIPANEIYKYYLSPATQLKNMRLWKEYFGYHQPGMISKYVNSAPEYIFFQEDNKTLLMKSQIEVNQSVYKLLQKTEKKNADLKKIIQQQQELLLKAKQGKQITESDLRNPDIVVEEDYEDEEIQELKAEIKDKLIF